MPESRQYADKKVKVRYNRKENKAYLLGIREALNEMIRAMQQKSSCMLGYTEFLSRRVKRDKRKWQLVIFMAQCHAVVQRK